MDNNSYSGKLCTIISEINENLIDHFKYSSKSQPADFQTWEELMNSKTGDCWAITNTITYPLRALGVPTAVDFITCRGNVNGGGHAWNALVLNNGKDIPFLGFEASPPDYSPFRIHKSLNRYPPKIFRKRFSKNTLALPMLASAQEVIPDTLNFDHVIDVTDHYLPTINIRVTLKKKRAPNIAYLSVFSNGTWQPVYWGIKNSDSFRACLKFIL